MPAFLEKAIASISPGWALQRSVARTMLNSYKGGVPTRTSELWPRTDGLRFSTSVDRMQLLGARDRAYNAYKNNPVAQTLINTETDNVIGDGLNYKPTSRESEAWNREAKDRYYDWLENVSVRGPDIHSGCELQRLFWNRSRVGGDAGLLLVNADFVNPDTGVATIRSQLQLVQAERIVTPDGRYGEPGVYDGIRYNDFNRPTQFFIKSQDEFGRRDFATVFARDFVWLPHMTDSDQARGETCYITIFDLLAHLDRYVDGVSLAAWMATVFGIVFKQNNASKQLGALPTLTNSQGNPQRAFTFENGMVKFVGTDEEVAQVQATQPMQQTPEFIRTMFRMLGQPFDMPLEVIAKDMSTCTFASARIGLLPFYRSCRIKAARFGSRWSRVIRWWLSREAQRAPNDPNRWDNPFPKDYFRHDLMINAWEYTDPVSEAQADLLQMSMLTKSPQMVIAERGRDAEQIVSEFVEWLTKTKTLPRVFSTMTRDEKPKQAGPAQQSVDAVKSYARAYADILASMNGSRSNVE